LGDIPDIRWVFSATETGPACTLTLLSTRSIILAAYLADLLFARWHSRDRFATQAPPGTEIACSISLPGATISAAGAPQSGLTAYGKLVKQIDSRIGCS